MTALSDAFYFGCESKERIGHFLFVPGLRSAYREEHVLPELLRTPDGTFAPHRAGCGMRPYCGCPQVEGRAVLKLVEGWTVLAFWDRSADGRGASNSVFLLRGVHVFDEAVRLSREAFPTVWARFPFEVVQA